MVKYSQSLKSTQPYLTNLDLPLLDYLRQVKDRSCLPCPLLVNWRDFFHHGGILARDEIYPLHASDHSVVLDLQHHHQLVRNL